jgi:hypothetical protein
VRAGQRQQKGDSRTDDRDIYQDRDSRTVAEGQTQCHSLMRVQQFKHGTDLLRKMLVVLCLGPQGLQLGGALDPVEEKGPRKR